MPDLIEPIAAAAGPEDWPAPDPGLLEESRPDLPDFPLHALPPFWAPGRARRPTASARRSTTSPRRCSPSVAGVCGAGVVARPREGWDEPLILWLALVGGPSSGKSPALDAMRRALAAVEKTAARGGPRPAS